MKFLLWLLRRLMRAFEPPDDQIVALIKPPRQIYADFDESLPKVTAERRQRADEIRRDARQLETRDDRQSRIHLVS